MGSRIIRTVVVGVGYLGQWHARKAASIKSVKLIGVVDEDFGRAESLAKELGCAAFGKVEDVPDGIESAIIAVPTEYHYKVANALLDKGAHILVEKPFTGFPKLAKKIINKAMHLKKKVAVGFVERMNSAFQRALLAKSKISFVEARRLAPFKLRAEKLDVVKDLMIHDIDLALCLLGEDVRVDYAWGERIITKKPDLTGAAFVFKGGAKAYLMAGRIFNAEERVMNIINKEGILTLDLKKQQVLKLKRARGEIVGRNLRISADDALLKELENFFRLVRKERSSIATGEEGLRALELACEVLKKAGRDC